MDRPFGILPALSESERPALLLSARYDNNGRSVVFLYYVPSTGQIRTVVDDAYKPYVYTRQPRSELGRLPVEDIHNMSTKKLHNLLTDDSEVFTKITMTNPYITSTLASLIPDLHETDIKCEFGCIYDTGRQVGAYYNRDDDEEPQSDKEIDEEMRTFLSDSGDADVMPDPETYTKRMQDTAIMLNQPIPKMNRLAIDIEVDVGTDGKMPKPEVADKMITAVGFEAFDRREVFVLDTDPNANKTTTQEGVTIIPYKSERAMIEDTLTLIDAYPILLTYNGENFDLPYIHMRATNLGIPGISRIMAKVGIITLMNGIHIDLYRVFSNRSLQLYAFGRKYSGFTLNEVSLAMTGDKKMEHEEFSEMPAEKLATYCQWDAHLTYNLSEFGNGIVMRLLVIIARLANMPVDAVSRTSVSSWLRSMLHNEHRRQGIIVPNANELAARTTGVDERAATKGKKYRGAMVLQPRVGMHFGVSVMDFASLYPSIIKVKNLSYETVRCPHEACRENVVPDTEHWVCRKQNGLIATLIGSLRDLRVNYYKRLAGSSAVTKKQSEEYNIMAQALKVILNASYGVIGSDFFSMYFLPLADSTTAYGRHILTSVVEKCAKRNLQVLYGDTDSLFLLKPSRKDVDEIILESKIEYGVDLEMEKEYRYVIMSDRKKNYLGVTLSGDVDIKGLTGKKSHTPQYIKDLFSEIVKMLSKVEDENGFIDVRNEIRKKIKKSISDLDGGKISLEDLAFTTILNKNLSAYGKKKSNADKRQETFPTSDDDQDDGQPSGIPQHAKAAMMLESGDLKKGDRIQYVKTNDACGVKPLALANFKTIDTRKYKDFLHSTLDQVITPLGLDWDAMEIGKNQSEMSAYMDML